MGRRARAWVMAGLLAVAASAFAQQAQVLDLPSRPGVTERLLVVRPAAEPDSVLVLLTGGNGQLGLYDNGSMRHDGNFLVRSRDLFVRRGHAVILVDTPSDHRELGGTFRDSPEHAADLGAVVAWARTTFGKPVWIVGTSRGTHSAANAAMTLRGAQAPDGIVLTSTILASNRFGSSAARPVQDWNLQELHIPVLVMHHQDDGCQVTPPARLPELMARLAGTRSALRTYTGGAARGPLCEAFAHHGFNGIEDQVVGDMSAWIREH